jgi:PAS domain S-box-containing protein
MDDQGKRKEHPINELKELREELALFKALSSENIQIVGVLRDFKEIYDNFYKSNPHPMWIYDLETLAFLDANNAAIKHYGYSLEEFLCMTIKDIRPAEDVPALLENIKKVTIGLDMAGTWRHIKKDGTIIFVEIISHTMTFSGKRAEIVLAFDITEQKRAEEEIKNTLSLLRATLESTADGILVVDRQGKIVSFNHKFLEMWNIPQKIVESRDDNQALSFVLNQLKNPEGFMNKVMELYAHPENESFDVLEFKDGRVFERYSQPQHTGEALTGRVWSFRNVTERKKADESLRAHEKELKKRVKDLEEFYNIAVGRELRMKDLKKEIEVLKEELEKYKNP